jgi:predicted ATPase
MGPAHLQELQVHNYGCLKDVTIGLTRLHAFVGPNDSGKSTILRAVQILEDLLKQLRMESQLIPEAEPLRFYDDRGHRLAGIYDAILNRGDEAFRQIVEKVTALFPTVKALRLRNVNQNTKALEVELRDGTRVPARFVSEGLLYYLAFACLQYLEPASILLVEEPDNGLHPVRIAEVMSVFREIAKTTQVLIATHSPLVINELTADEVSVVTRTPQEGTKVRTLAATPNIRERTKVYSLGELWLSYANGVDESALFSGQTKP